MIISMHTIRKLFWYIIPFFIAILPFVFISRNLLLTNPFVWPDESITVDIAKTIFKSFPLKTNIFGENILGISTINGPELPLYTYIPAIWLKLSGYSIISVRLFSVLLGGLTLLLVYIIANSYFKNRLLGFFAVILMYLDPYFSESTRIGRVEIINILVICSILIFLNPKNMTRVRYFFIGILLGIAMLTHPICIIYVGIVFGYIYIYFGFKEIYKSFVLLVTPTLIGLGYWWYMIRPWMKLIIIQMRWQTGFKSQAIPSLWLQAQSDLSIMFILFMYIFTIFVLAYIYFKTRQKMGLFLGMSMIILFGAVMYGKEMWYPAYFEPMYVFALLFIWVNLKVFKDIIRFTIRGVLGVLILIYLNTTITHLTQNIKNSDYGIFGTEIQDVIPGPARVLLSEIPDVYFVLQNNPKLQIFEFINNYYDKNTYFKFLDTIDYIVLNFVPNRLIYEYANINVDKKFFVGSDTGYQAVIYKLLPLNKRKKD
jgi:4-amino-4-deoxy-L-arabinose transferase-like glycosyltransferase